SSESRASVTCSRTTGIAALMPDLPSRFDSRVRRSTEAASRRRCRAEPSCAARTSSAGSLAGSKPAASRVSKDQCDQRTSTHSARRSMKLATLAMDLLHGPLVHTLAIHRWQAIVCDDTRRVVLYDNPAGPVGQHVPGRRAEQPLLARGVLG